jgi:hypothetical protein
MSEEDAVTLPETPEEDSFEEFVASALQAAGLLVQRNLEQWTDQWFDEKDPVLELDAIVTDYNVTPPKTILVEAKSGSWGFKHLFKVGGWMEYIDADESLFVVKDDDYDDDKYSPVTESMGINVISVPEVSGYSVLIDELEEIPNTEVNDWDIAGWWFYYRVKNELLRIAQRNRYDNSGNPGPTRFHKIWNYSSDISDSIFFSDTTRSQIKKLYRSFSENRKLSARCATEIETGEYPQGSDCQIPSDIFERTIYNGDVNEVQTSLMLEHQARSSLLKSAVDYVVECGDDAYTINNVSFPDTFEQAVAINSKNEYFAKYPLLWKIFIGIFGGFILEEMEDVELENLSRLSGIPVDKIGNAFDAYGDFFPYKRGWFWSQNNITKLRLYPVPIRGIGVHYRTMIYTENGELEELLSIVSHRNTKDDLLTWNDSGYRTLSD